MIREVRLLLLWLAFIPLGTSAQGIDDIMEGLRRLQPYVGNASAKVIAPGADTPTECSLRMFASAIADTAIAPCSYLIEQRLVGRDSVESFGGLTATKLYRYDGRRFTEYSAADGSLTPQLARGVQFAELLPAFIVSTLDKALAGDYSRVEVRRDGPDRIVVELIDEMGGIVYGRRLYTLSSANYAPIGYEYVANEGSPAEMSVSAVFTPAKSSPRVVDEALLMERHGDIISRFTQANRRPENFVGYPLPPFTLPDMRGGRYSFTPRDETLLVLIDDEADPDALEEITSDVRRALGVSPRGATLDVRYIILSRFTDAIRASDAPSGRELLLLGGRSLAREYGAREFPLFILVDADGIVDAVASGINKPAGEIVIEMLDN